MDITHNLDENYLNHFVFDQLNEYVKFYNTLADHVMQWLSNGIYGNIINIDTYVYSSMAGTIESIKDVLLKGRINDAYALLRKYHDVTIINIYTNLYLEDKFNLESMVVARIDNWVKGKEKLPYFDEMSKYITNSSLLENLTSVISNGDDFKGIRGRCNDHTHYNFYYYLVQNDNQIVDPDRTRFLTSFSTDMEAIFIQHISYIFYLKDNYLMSSYYLDCIEMGMTPEENSEYYVAEFIQNIFDKFIKAKRPDVANIILENTTMYLK